MKMSTLLPGRTRLSKGKEKKETPNSRLSMNPQIAAQQTRSSRKTPNSN